MPVMRKRAAGEQRSESLVSIAPIAWQDLGPNSGVAFLGKQQRMREQWGKKSDITVYPERDTNNPANDPCRDCYCIYLASALVLYIHLAMSKVFSAL